MNSQELREAPLITIAQFCKAYPWPSASALRAMIWKAEEFGLVDAIIRVKGRVLIDPKMFFFLIRDNEARKTNKLPLKRKSK